MNARERLRSFIDGLPVDRTPNLTIIGAVVTQYTGIGIDIYCKDYREMVKAATLAAHDLKLDFIQVASDLARAAEGYGSKLTYSKDKLPTVTVHALKDILDAESLKPLTCREIPRLFDLVKATELAQQDPEIPAMTLATGPMTVAGNIRGVEDLMLDMLDEPEASGKLLDTVTFTIIDFIKELAKAGAEYVYIADPVASLVSPAAYKEMILPCHKRIFTAMKELGITGRLHMCGDTTGIIPYSRDCGAAIVDVDHAVDFNAALVSADGHCIINGNIDPVSDVYSCDREHVKAAIKACAEKADGRRAMFMPGCELPALTDLGNVKAIAEAIAEIGA